MLTCVLCDKRVICSIESFGACDSCFEYYELTETSIRKALESLTKDNVDVAPLDNLFHEPDLIKVKAKTNGHKNGSGKHTREITEQTVRIFDRWKELNEHPDAELSGERADCIIRHLTGSGKYPIRTEADLVKCLLGYSIEPIMVNGKRFDSIKLLFKDADHIEKGIDIANRTGQRQQSLVRGTGAERYSDIFREIRQRRQR